MKKCIFPLILTMLISSMIYFSACRREDSIDVNQDRIYTRYEMNYNANAEETTAKAIFRLGGQHDSKLKLSDGSSIEFNEETLSYNGIYAYYENTYSEFINEGEFRFEDLEDNVYTNSVDIITADFPEEMDTIVKDSTYELFWDGDPLTAGEKITLTIDGPLESDAKMFHVSEEGAESIELSESETSTLSSGATILELERKYESENIDAPSVGGKIISTYKAANYATNVME
ncbi:MAG: hypothetical protein ACQES1_11040 [Bacteroidota bacterium]